MRWLAKAALQKALTLCPGSERLNYFLQRHVSKNYPRSEKDFLHWIDIAAQHFHVFVEHGSANNLSDVTFYEFGAGWDLLILLAYHAFGVNRQIVVDINPLIHLELVSDTLRRFSACKGKLEASLNRTLRDLGGPPLRSVAELRKRFGIIYHAPLDARSTGLQPSYVDFISSTATLEHIPPSDIYHILVECSGILKPGGIMSHRVDMVDHLHILIPIFPITTSSNFPTRRGAC